MRKPGFAKLSKTMNDWKTIVLSMRDNAQEKGITHQEIADKAGMKRENVTLLFGLKRPPTLTTLCRVADAIGVTVQAD